MFDRSHPNEHFDGVSFSIATDEAKKILENGTKVCFMHRRKYYCSTIKNIDRRNMAELNNGFKMHLSLLKNEKEEKIGKTMIDVDKVFPDLPTHFEEVLLVSNDIYDDVLRFFSKHDVKGDLVGKDFKKVPLDCLLSGTIYNIDENRSSMTKSKTSEKLQEKSNRIRKENYLERSWDCNTIPTMVRSPLASMMEISLKRGRAIDPEHAFINEGFPSIVDENQSKLLDEERKKYSLSNPKPLLDPYRWRHILATKWMKNGKQTTVDTSNMTPNVGSITDEDLNNMIDVFLPFVNANDYEIVKELTGRKHIPASLQDPVFSAVMTFKEDRSRYLPIKNNMLESDNNTFWERFALLMSGDESKRALRNIINKSFDPKRREEIVDMFLKDKKENYRRFILEAYDLWGDVSNCEPLERLSNDNSENLSTRSWALMKEKCPARYMELVEDELIKSRGKKKTAEMLEEIMSVFSFVGYHKKEVDNLLEKIVTNGNENAKEGLIDSVDPDNAYKPCKALEVLAKDATLDPTYQEKTKVLMKKLLC